ncbi:COP9 signalosome complex subunit 12 [Trypanosoma rangeli]|uniref:COP9 signalosome complex subunit 12 n=1 Tax=Trypanosoma rangeli TaxID=5698 RepID=A0A3R7LU45_TRYRA|nr:COP9 signalosome complex subunit 12 [Trypanosoma rangeli]RNF03372.1 COP9 signalosome complex subunit 12 [Trypanosoma rangeli]|eukprot:RNF03372.1 COP9 signalosome complex subunit 12 [Trypanosoma rangeli]
MRRSNRTTEAQAALTVSPDWLQQTADAIAGRNGILLTDCVTLAEEGSVTEPPSAVVLANIEAAVEGLRRTLEERVEASHAGLRGDRAEDVKERQLYVDVMVRLAVTVALARSYCPELQSRHNGGDGPESGGERLPQRYYDTLARGMLHVFEAFQEVHSMQRGHYTARRRGGSTIGTVGWDTLLLLHFVHRIPRVARDASEHVIDEATGQIVRSWRKLLQSLQAADPQEPPEHSRRRGALAVCNGLLSILFHHYNTHQCRILLNAVAQSEKAAESTQDWGKSILRPAQHMTAEVVNFCYYKGRIMLYDHRFAEAYAALREAYYLLPPPGEGTEVQQRNKQRVRFYLTVAGVVHGRVVPEEILCTDDLIAFVFMPILAAVQRGDPEAFANAVDAFGTLLRKRGVFFLLQQAKLYCFLVLLARTHAALGACGVDNSRVPLPVLTAAYAHVVEEGHAAAAASATKPKRPKRHRDDGDTLSTAAAMTDDKMTWWTAKLIAADLVRGYISYEHKTIVLSRQVPFPTLGTPLPPP